TSGPDTLTPKISIQGDKIESLEIIATAEEEVRPHRLSVSLFNAQLTRTATFDVDIPSGNSTTVIPEATGEPAPSLVLLNDGDHTYAKVRLDDVSLGTIPQILDKLQGGAEEELSRAVIWTSLWNMTRDGQWPAREFIAAVLQHAPGEANATLMATNFANARHAAAHFLPADPRDAA